MTNVLELLKNTGINPQKASSSGGGEYHSPCPSCGDHSRPKESDRFQVYPARNENSGWYICRRCGLKGDSIQFLRDFEGKSYREACHILGIEPKSKEQHTSAIQRMTTPRPPETTEEQFQPEEKDLPCSQWLEKAEAFTTWCHEQLLKNSKALAWLAERGIQRESVILHRLGYNPGNPAKPGQALYKSRSDWGLPEEMNPKTGRKKTLWLPLGWVIPMIDGQGRVIQLRIRRLDREIKKFLPSMKYRVIPGSTVATMVLFPDAPAFVVVENGLDAILVAQEGRGLAGAITTWNSTAKPDSAATSLLKKANCILLAQDYDEAGRDGASWWKKHFSKARRWPVAAGKDAGEAYALGEDLNGWIEAGLAPYKALAVPALPLGMIAPGLGSEGEGAKTSLDEQGEGNEQSPEKNEMESSRIITLDDGREFHVTESQVVWEKLVDAGEVVFSENELSRLSAACKECDAEGAKSLASSVLDLKAVFDGAYIKRGGKQIDHYGYEKGE